MTVREFDGSDDDLTCSIGGMAGATFGTAVFLVKRGTTGDWNSLTVFDTNGLQFAFHSNSQLALFTGNTFFGPEWANTDDWAIVVFRVAAADAAVEFSIRDLTTETWTHDSSGSTLTTWSALSTNMLFSWGGGDLWQGRIAARAFWADSVPWATTGAVEAAGLETGAAAWMDAGPSTMHLFDQASVGTAVEDLTEGGADQTAITGTTVVTDDDPPGWDFSLVDEPIEATGALAPGAAAASGSGSAPVSGSGAVRGGSAVLSGAVGAAVGGDGALSPVATSLAGSGAVAVSGSGELTAAAAVLFGQPGATSGSSTLAVPTVPSAVLQVLAVPSSTAVRPLVPTAGGAT